MKKIIVVGLCLLLIGGLIMPAQAYNFTIQINPPIGENVSIYDSNEKLIGKTNETGIFTFCLDDLELGEKRYLTLKKEGYEDTPIKIYNAGCDNGIFGTLLKVLPKTIPVKSTPEILATAAPFPEEHKSQKQRITDLENTTAEQETKISELEKQITTILNWIKTKFGDVI